MRQLVRNQTRDYRLSGGRLRALGVPDPVDESRVSICRADTFNAMNGKGWRPRRSSSASISQTLAGTRSPTGAMVKALLLARRMNSSATFFSQSGWRQRTRAS